MNATAEKPQQISGVDVASLASSGLLGRERDRNSRKSDTPLAQPRSGFDLPAIRRRLHSLERSPALARLRKQLSNYERGSDEAKEALRPAILRRIKQLSK